MAEPLSVRCGAESRWVGEALVGTASTIQAWLAVEQPGAWGPKALRESALDPAVSAAIERAASPHGVRVLLIRRPRRSAAEAAADGRRRVYLAHTGREGRWIEQLDLPADDLAELADLPFSDFGLALPPGIGTVGPRSVHLVCTHGRHDPCCADYGRPVVRALVDAGVDEVWETSHIGGDRFAANILALPEGIYYGRVEPERAVALVTDHRAGLIDLDHYRGVSCWPPAVQAAEAFAREWLDERGVDAVSVTSVIRQDGVLRVRVVRDDGTGAEVDVTRHQAEARQLTCHAAGEAQPWRFERAAIRPLPR